MTWNYRIIKHDIKTPTYFAIHEVYYDDRGNIDNWTEAPIEIIGESKLDIIKNLKLIARDTEQPVLKESELLKSIQMKKKDSL